MSSIPGTGAGPGDAPRAGPRPTYQQTHCLTVTAEQCDHLGHMNVQHYFAAVSDGMIALMARIGLSPEEIVRRQLSFAIVHAVAAFHRELHAGDHVTLESTVEDLAGASATFGHRLRHVATGAVVMTARLTCVLLHLQARHIVAIPADLRDAVSALFGVSAAAADRFP